MRDNDLQKLWETYSVQKEGYPSYENPNTPHGYEPDFLPGVDDEPHPEELTPQDLRNDIISTLDKIDDMRILIGIEKHIVQQIDTLNARKGDDDDIDDIFRQGKDHFERDFSDDEIHDPPPRETDQEKYGYPGDR
jgi:hypothetical protein